MKLHTKNACVMHEFIEWVSWRFILSFSQKAKGSLSYTADPHQNVSRDNLIRNLNLETQLGSTVERHQMNPASSTSISY